MKHQWRGGLQGAQWGAGTGAIMMWRNVKVPALVLCVPLVGGSASKGPAAIRLDEMTAGWRAGKRLPSLSCGDREIEPTETLRSSSMLPRAQDAALTAGHADYAREGQNQVSLPGNRRQPSPLAAHVTFGPAGRPTHCSCASGSIPTPMCTPWLRPGTAVCSGAVGVQPGALLSGGCSSAGCVSRRERTMKGMGEMRMRFTEGGRFPAEKPMQSAPYDGSHLPPISTARRYDQLTRNYTPPCARIGR